MVSFCDSIKKLLILVLSIKEMLKELFGAVLSILQSWEFSKISTQNPGNGISENLDSKLFWGSMPPYPLEFLASSVLGRPTLKNLLPALLSIYIYMYRYIGLSLLLCTHPYLGTLEFFNSIYISHLNMLEFFSGSGTE